MLFITEIVFVIMGGAPIAPAIGEANLLAVSATPNGLRGPLIGQLNGGL